MKTQDGRLIVIGGASRSGKTAWTRREVAKAERVFAYDPEDQWSHERGFIRVTKRADLLKLAHKAGPLKVAYVAGGDLKAEFDFWAGCVMYAGRYIGPLSAIAEELADVTSPGKAPGNWGVLIRRGLKRGITIYAISQRWAEADKTAFGNASAYVIFRLSSGDDIRYFSRKTRISEADIEGLLPTLDAQGNPLICPFMVKNNQTGQVDRSQLDFRRVR
jgi:hypothetical protein